MLIRGSGLLILGMTSPWSPKSSKNYHKWFQVRDIFGAKKALRLKCRFVPFPLMMRLRSRIFPGKSLLRNPFCISTDGLFSHCSHGNKEVFSCRGIQLAVDWFRDRGHTYIKVFVPSWRKEPPRADTPIRGMLEQSRAQEGLRPLPQGCS